MEDVGYDEPTYDNAYADESEYASDEAYVEDTTDEEVVDADYPVVLSDNRSEAAAAVLSDLIFCIASRWASFENARAEGRAAMRPGSV